MCGLWPMRFARQTSRTTWRGANRLPLGALFPTRNQRAEKAWAFRIEPRPRTPPEALEQFTKILNHRRLLSWANLVSHTPVEVWATR